MRAVFYALTTWSAVAALSKTGMAQNPASPQQPAAPMTFFITSAGKGDGANLGGLAGADEHCASLAQAAGAQLPAGRVWRAYLSATGTDGKPIHARDRIGAGPWHNAKGALIAATVADLHGDVVRDRNQINKANALTEKGQPVNGVGDTPNMHDMLTGSDTEGRALPGTADTNCSNWTSNAATGSAMLWASRSHRRRQHVVELGAPVARVRPSEPRGYRRRGTVLLLRGELVVGHQSRMPTNIPATPTTSTIPTPTTAKRTHL
jgi:hypothetical protein